MCATSIESYIRHWCTLIAQRYQTDIVCQLIYTYTINTFLTLKYRNILSLYSWSIQTTESILMKKSTGNSTTYKKCDETARMLSTAGFCTFQWKEYDSKQPCENKKITRCKIRENLSSQKCKYIAIDRSRLYVASPSFIR